VKPQEVQGPIELPDPAQMAESVRRIQDGTQKLLTFSEYMALRLRLTALLRSSRQARRDAGKRLGMAR